MFATCDESKRETEIYRDRISQVFISLLRFYAGVKADRFFDTMSHFEFSRVCRHKVSLFSTYRLTLPFFNETGHTDHAEVHQTTVSRVPDPW